jgi:Immunity protein 50
LVARFHIQEFIQGSDQNYLITLKFLEVERLVLEEFNYQNAINGLEFEKGTGRYQQSIKVTIHGGFGVDGSFVCTGVKVLGFEPFTPPETYW